MAKLRIEEISSLIKEQIKRYSDKLETQEVGSVVSVGDGIALVHGLDKAMSGGIITIPEQRLWHGTKSWCECCRSDSFLAMST